MELLTALVLLRVVLLVPIVVLPLALRVTLSMLNVALPVPVVTATLWLLDALAQLRAELRLYW